MSSGIKVDPEAAETYADMQARNKYKWIIMGFNDKKNKVVLMEKGDKDSNFEEMMKVLPKNHVCYVFYDCAYETLSGQGRNKILFVLWSSDDDAPRTEKMIGTTTSKEVEAKCPKYSKKTVINDYSELTEANFIDIVSDGRTK